MAPIDDDPLARPSFTTQDDVRSLPPTVIGVHQCHPSRRGADTALSIADFARTA